MQPPSGPTPRPDVEDGPLTTHASGPISQATSERPAPRVSCSAERHAPAAIPTPLTPSGSSSWFSLPGHPPARAAPPLPHVSPNIANRFVAAFFLHLPVPTFSHRTRRNRKSWEPGSPPSPTPNFKCPGIPCCAPLLSSATGYRAQEPILVQAATLLFFLSLGRLIATSHALATHARARPRLFQPQASVEPCPGTCRTNSE